MSLRLFLLTAALVLGPAAGAQAAWVPPQTIDGPNNLVDQVGGVDLARDGTGALAYLRIDGDGPHVFVSRLFNGVWTTPVRVDPGLPPATEVKVAVGDGNRMAVAWIAADSVFGVSTPTSTGPAPFTAPVQLGGPGAKSIDVDLGVNDAAYAVWQQGGDVRASRLQDAGWTTLPSPIDIAPVNEAGTGDGRPRVAVSAEGYAVATWGEGGRVWARRLTGLNLSQFPQPVSPEGELADSPDIDIEDDGSFAWVVYRQNVGGVPHTYARRLVGSTFDPPAQIDGGAPAVEPRIDMGGRGQGEGVSQGLDNTVWGATLDRDVFEQSFPLGNSPVPSKPEVAATDRGDLALAWRAGGTARARVKPYRTPFSTDVQVSNPALGPVNDPGVFVGADRTGDYAIAMVQGEPGAKSLVVTSFDDPPGAPYIGKEGDYARKTRPELKWRPGLDLWGEQTFHVFVDGVDVGQTKSDSLVPAAPLKTGTHKWYVQAVDIHGQTSTSRVRTMKLDATAPTLKVKVSGKRQRGQTIKIRVTVSDRGGSGLDHTTIDYGDKSATTRSRSVSHRYRAGSFTLKVSAVDKAGNVTRKSTKLRIKK